MLVTAPALDSRPVLQRGASDTSCQRMGESGRNFTVLSMGAPVMTSMMALAQLDLEGLSIPC